MGALCTNHRSGGNTEEGDDGGGAEILLDESANVQENLTGLDSGIPLIPDDNEEEETEIDASALAPRETVQREIDDNRRRSAYTKSVYHHAQTDRDTV